MVNHYHKPGYPLEPWQLTTFPGLIQPQLAQIAPLVSRRSRQVPDVAAALILLEAVQLAESGAAVVEDLQTSEDDWLVKWMDDGVMVG